MLNLNKPITMSGWKLAAGLLLFWSTGASIGQIPPEQLSPFLRPLAHYVHTVANVGSIVFAFMLVWASRREKPASAGAAVPPKMITPAEPEGDPSDETNFRS